MVALTASGKWIAGQATQGAGVVPPAYESYAIQSDKLAGEPDRSTTSMIATLRRLGDLVVGDPDKLQKAGGEWCVTTSLPEAYGRAGDSEQLNVARAASTGPTNE